MADPIQVSSILCKVRGVKFYDGLSELHSLMHVRLCREASNPVDPCSILVKTSSGKTLGHVEKKVKGRSRNCEKGVLYNPDQPLQLRHQGVGLEHAHWE